MKIARFNGRRIGVVLADGVVDVTAAAGVQPSQWPPVGPVVMIRDFAARRPAMEVQARTGPRIPLSQVHFETPVPWPHKLIAIPVNYEAHAVEMSSPAISRNAGFS